MQSCNCRRTLRCILSLTLLAGSAPLLFAQAPTETPAHRVLELPKNGSADLQKQMFLLKQLQSMLGGLQPDTKPQSPPPVLPEQLQNMKKLLDQFGGQIPEGMMPRPEDISPEMIEQVKSNPQLKRQVEQMLEQYKRDGRLPQSDGRGGFQMPLPPTENNKPKPKPETDAEPDFSIPPANRRPDPRPDGSQPPNPPQRQPSESKKPTPEDSTRRSDALQRLKEMWEQANPSETANDLSTRPGTERTPGPRGTPSGNSSSNEPGGEPNGQLSGDDITSAPLPDSAAGWDKLLNELIQQQRDGANGKTPAQNLPPSGTPRSLGANGQSGSDQTGQPSGQSTDRRNGKPSVQEFLEQMKDVVPPDFKSTQTAANAESDPNGDEAAAQAAREEVVKRQQETSESLRDKGLKATLKNIVKDAQRKAKEDRVRALASGDSPESTAPGEAGMSQAVLETLNGIRKDVFEMMKDGDITISGDSNNTSSASRPSRVPQSDRSESMLGGFREVAGELISDLSTPEPLTPDTTASADSILPGGPMSLGSWIVPLLVLALIGGLLAWRMGLVDVSGVLSANSQTISSDQVRTKADVVRAFHSMALKPVRKTQHWWTHQMVKQDIVAQAPEKTYQVGVLAELYEHARYLPDEQDFTPEQIEEARRALQQCEGR